MKRKFSFLVAVFILIAGINGVAAFAQNGNMSLEDETDTSNSSSPRAVAYFHNYLATLDKELAQLILQDEELVYMMTQDAYWAPQPKTVAPRAVTLPLSSYQSGSYYTANGRACTCHSMPCSYVVGTGGSSDLCYVKSTKAPGNCKRYAHMGSIQCKGFADYVFKLYNNKEVSSSTQVDGISSIGSTQGSKFKDYLNNLPIGSNIRVSSRSGNYDHSFILAAISPAGATIYDCNSAGTCNVNYYGQSWETLASKYDAILSAWK